MTENSNVLIVGGGIVGLTAALAIAQQGYTVAVLDSGALATETPQTGGRVYALNHASQNLLQQVGSWQHIDPQRVSFYQHMYVWDAVSGAHIDFDSRSVAASSLGAIIEEAVLKNALLHHIARQPGISLFSGCTVDEVRCETDAVFVSSQHQLWQAELLCIADGANSPTREKLRVALTTWPYKQQALVATVAVEKAHQKTAYQVFNPDGPLAFLPLANPHQCSIVWSTEPMHAKKLMDLTDEEFNEALTQAFAKKLGQVKVLGPRSQFPLHMRHVKQYSGSRWLLLGDAAHTIHPLAGQGLNVGLADVRSWINCLNTQPRTLVSKKALGAYQRERKHEVWQVIAIMEGFKRVFSNSFTPMSTLRGLGLGLCNELPFIKRLFIQHARGIDSLE